MHTALSRIERAVGVGEILSGTLDVALRDGLVVMQAGRLWLTDLGERTLDDWDTSFGVPVV